MSEISKFDRHMSFTRGWMDGAGGRAIRLDQQHIPDYDLGYGAGQVARKKALAAHAKAIGHTPNIIRTMAKEPEAK